MKWFELINRESNWFLLKKRNFTFCWNINISENQSVSWKFIFSNTLEKYFQIFIWKNGLKFNFPLFLTLFQTITRILLISILLEHLHFHAAKCNFWWTGTLAISCCTKNCLVYNKQAKKPRIYHYEIKKLWNIKALKLFFMNSKELFKSKIIPFFNFSTDFITNI